MRRVLCFFLILSLTFSTVLLTGCSNKNAKTSANSKDEWVSHSKLQESILLENYDKDSILGDIEKDGITVKVPKGAFKNGTKLIISKPEKGYSYNKNSMMPKGYPFEFRIEGEQGRSDMPILVKIAIDKNNFEGLKEFEGFRGVHFSEESGWTYTYPVEVNREFSYIAFNIYNNPLWGTAELTEEERKEQFLKGKALQSWGEKQLEGDIRQATKETIESILVNQFNAKNKSEIEKIALEVMKELKYGTLEYGKLANDLMNKDFKSYTANVATMIGKTFAQSMEADNMSTLFGQTGSVVAATGHLWEGDYSGAGMKIAEAILDTSPVYKAAKLAVDVVDIKINNWKNNGIEEAYKAYKEGSNDYILFGYDVDPGDFEAVWDQMRGVARQIEMDAIKKYASSIGVKESELSSEQIKIAKDRVKKNLKDQFEKRIKQEAEIEKEKENQREVILQFEKWNLLKKGSTWYPEDSSVEQMLERLYNQIKRIQKEIGRFDLVYRDGDLHDQSRGLDNIGKLKSGEILVSDLAELINTRYVFGEEEYKKKLKEMGYIQKAKLGIGTYKGTIVITDAPIVEYAQKGLEEPEKVPEIKGPDGEKCEELDFNSADIQAKIKEAIDKAKNVVGKEVPLTIVITQGESKEEFKSSVKIDFASAFPDYGCEDASKPQPFTVKYAEDKLTLTRRQDEQKVTETYAGEADYEDTFKGSYNMLTDDTQYSDYTKTNTIISGEWKVKKVQ